MERHVFELLNRERDEHCHEEHHHHHLDKNRSSCRVYGQFALKIGDLLEYDITLNKLVASTSQIIDFIVVDVDDDNKWIEIANTGVYSIGRTFKNGKLCNTGTGKIEYSNASNINAQSIGAIINGYILVNVR